MAKKPRLKSAAADAPQTRDAVMLDIKKIGDLQREITRLETAMNDQIGEITEEFSGPVKALQTELEALQSGVQTYCEAHRAELTDNNRVKFVNLITGEVQWRCRPPSVSVRGQDAVLELLKEKGLPQFIRTRNEINKEAILNEPKLAEGIPGITIRRDVEDFAIIPFEQEVQ